MIRLICTIEIEDADTPEEARAKLDAFREAVLPARNYGVTIYEDHIKVKHGQCPTCGHYGEDCTGTL